MSYLAIGILVYAAYVPLGWFIVATFGEFWDIPLSIGGFVGLCSVVGLLMARINSIDCSSSWNRLKNHIVLKNCDGDTCVRYIVLKKTLFTESTEVYTLRPFDTIVLSSMTGGFRVIDETRFENFVGDSSPKLLSVQ